TPEPAPRARKASPVPRADLPCAGPVRKPASEATPRPRGTVPHDPARPAHPGRTERARAGRRRSEPAPLRGARRTGAGTAQPRDPRRAGGGRVGGPVGAEEAAGLARGRTAGGGDRGGDSEDPPAGSGRRHRRTRPGPRLAVGRGAAVLADPRGELL